MVARTAARGPAEPADRVGGSLSAQRLPRLKARGVGGLLNGRLEARKRCDEDGCDAGHVRNVASHL